MVIEWKRRLYIPMIFSKELNFSKEQEVEISLQYGEICIEKFKKENWQEKPFIGVVRNLDSHNRVIIPSEYLNLLDFNFGDLVNLELDNGVIKVKK